MSPSMYLADIPEQGRLMFYRMLYDMLSLKGLAPGGYAHQGTSQGLRDVIYHPDVLEAVGEPTCAACEAPQDCSAKDICMLCSKCRSERQNLMLQQVRAENLGEWHCRYFFGLKSMQAGTGFDTVGWGPCGSRQNMEQYQGTSCNKLWQSMTKSPTVILLKGLLHNKTGWAIAELKDEPSANTKQSCFAVAPR